MALSPAERQQRRRDKLRLQDTVSVRLNISGQLHSQLARQAKLKEVTLQELMIRKLKRR